MKKADTQKSSKKKNSDKKYLLLNLPDTSENIIQRGWAGTFGTASIRNNNQKRIPLPIWILYSISAFIIITL